MGKPRQPKDTHPIMVLAGFFGGLGLMAALILFFLDPFEDKQDTRLKKESLQKNQARTLIKGVDSDPETIQRVAPETAKGRNIEIKGVVSFNGAALAGVKIQAFCDHKAKASYTFKERVKSSLFYHSAAGAKLRTRVDMDGFFEDPMEENPPVAEDLTGADGAYAMQVPFSKSVTFLLDHDFYYFDNMDFKWVEENQFPRLAGYDGILEAELGAMVCGQVTDLDDYGVPGCIVELAPRVMRQDRERRKEIPGRHAITDSEGYFVFQGATAHETYLLKTKAEGWASLISEPFETAPGQIHRTNLALRNGACIQVHIKDHTGQVLPGAEVFLERETRKRKRGKLRGKADLDPKSLLKTLVLSGDAIVINAFKTDDRGSCLFSDIASGSYRVRACFPGYVEATTPQPLNILEATKTLHVNLNLAMGLTINGKVRDDLGQPIPNALVKARPQLDGKRRGEGLVEMLLTPTGALKEARAKGDGVFRITGLKDNQTFVLRAEADGYARGSLRDAAPGGDLQVIELDRLGAVKGFVVNSSNSMALRNFSVRLIPPLSEDAPNPRRFREKMAKALEDENSVKKQVLNVLQESVDRLMDREKYGPKEFKSQTGEFLLENIPSGEYSLCVSGENLTPKVVDPFKVEKGEIHDRQTIGLDPGGEISGQVGNMAGPVKDAKIRIIPKERRDPKLRIQLDAIEEVKSDQDGSFIVKGLPPGEFYVRASLRDYPIIISDPVTLAQGQSVTNVSLTFPMAAVIKGFALDEMGAPLAKENVSCRSKELGRKGRRVKTDKNGYFEIKDLRAGTYQVSIQGDKKFFRRLKENKDGVTVDVEAGDVREVTLTRKPPEGVAISGVIFDQGVPIKKGLISISSMEGGRGKNAAVQSNGGYKVYGVSPGINRVTVRLGRSQSHTLQIDVPDMPVMVQNIELPGGEISGYVSDGATGLPINNARLSISMVQDKEEKNEQRFSKKSAETREDGFFVFKMLGPGTYRIRAESPKVEGVGYYPAFTDNLILKEEQTLGNVKLTLFKGGGILAFVTDANNNPLGKVSITALMGNNAGSKSRSRGYTNREGEAKINNLAPGMYTLLIKGPKMAQQIRNNVKVSPDLYTEVTASLEQGVNVSLRLTDEKGQPINSATLTLKTSNGGSIKVPRKSTKKKGKSNNIYLLGALAFGEYEVKARWNKKSGSGRFKVNGGGTILVKVQ